MHAALRCGMLPHGAEKRLMSPPLLVMAAFDGMIDGRKGTRTWLEHTDPVNMRFYTEDNAQFPAFVKALKGTYGMGIRIVHNRSQFDATLGGAFLSLGKCGARGF